MRWGGRRRTASSEIVLAPRDERALVAIASHAEQLDVRMHSARVAAELARVTVELRAEIEDRVAASAVKESRLRTLAESIADLSDSLDTTPADWAASA